MKLSDNARAAWLVVFVSIVVAFVFVVYLLPRDIFDKSKIYTEAQGNFTFVVPESFGLQREQITPNEVFIKVVAPNDTALANPGLANVIVYKKGFDGALDEQAEAFLGVDKNQLFKFNSDENGYSYLLQSGQEASLYYFFDRGDSVVVFKYNKSYFDKSNPMMLIDNSLYANTFLRALNTLKFN